MFRNPIADALVVIVIVLLFFGPKRLPELGRSLGSGLREFKDGITGSKGDSDDERPELTRASDSGGAGTQADASAAKVGAERRP
jgi:sec-independent protein translocase protein TatA